MSSPTPHPATLEDSELLTACEIRFTRRGGPGGQHRNKVETAVILRHRPTGLSAEAHELRSQSENRRVALSRLRFELAVHFRSGSSDRSIDVSTDNSTYSSTDSSTKGSTVDLVDGSTVGQPKPVPRAVSPLWKSRRQGTRIAVADDHRDLPSLLAEALDVLDRCGHVPTTAAEHLGITASQLIRLLRRYPPALQSLNAQRHAIGKPPLN